MTGPQHWDANWPDMTPHTPLHFFYHTHSSTQSIETSPGQLHATKEMCYHCFDVLINALQNRLIAGGTISQTKIPCNFASQLANPQIECPLFVTWDTFSRRDNSWQLCGCIGTLSPRPLVQAVGEYAEIAALRDRRFRPVSLEEVESLRVAVSLLVQYETCKNAYDWQVGVHGIMIQFKVAGRSYSATYLPEVAQEKGWTVPQTLTSLAQKAGYHGDVTVALLQTIQCKRYQSSKTRVTFEDYVVDHCKGINPVTAFLASEASKGGALNSGQSCNSM